MRRTGSPRSVRAAADRREGLARLTGQVNSLRSRGEAAAAEIGRLTAAQREAADRAEQASRSFTALETKVAGLDAGEHGLDAEHEEALEVLNEIEQQQADVRRQEQAATQERAALAARVDALRVGLNRKDGSSALLAATDRLDGLLGSVAALVSVQTPYETAVAAAFGAAADAVAVTGIQAAVGAFDHLKAEDLGRAGLLLGGVTETETDRANGRRFLRRPGTRSTWSRYRTELAPAVQRVLRKVAVVENLPAARSLIANLPDVVAVTNDGDVLSAHFAAGGSSATPTLIELQSAVDDAERRLTDASHACDRLRFVESQLDEQHRQASATVEVTLARLHESDAAMAALAEELGQLSSTVRSANAEADRAPASDRRGRKGA